MHEALLVTSKKGLLPYLHNVVIDSRPDPKPFGQVAEKWQWDNLKPILPAIECACGMRKDYCGPRSFFRQMRRGSDKTSSIARILNWSIFASKRKIVAYACAKDKDQAGLISKAMRREAELNPWFGKLLQIDKYTAYGPTGEVNIIAADASGSYGYVADLLIVDELAHWPKREMWTTLMSGRSKVGTAVVVCLTNSGWKRTWQWDMVQEIKNDVMWNSMDLCVTPGWINKLQEESDRKKIPASEAARLYDNAWVDPSGSHPFGHDSIELSRRPGRGIIPLPRFGSEEDALVASRDFTVP